jgi:hypothetical protein
MYPVSSTNVADLENLMDVYLDAVLHPAIYNRPRIFEQEGWHYELTDDDQLVYNGVVFNEMKGALSDPGDVLAFELGRALFPESPYRFESGGDPRAIPTLTYERFIDHHARHYNLPNSYTILYGDLDIERELAFVGERFDAACDRGAGEPNPLDLQKPVASPLRRVEMATAPENASVSLAYVLGTAADRERVLATDVLLDIVATPISPELIPADAMGNIKQKTEDLVGPYELHDFFIYYFLRWGFTPKKIYLLAQKAFDRTYDDQTIRKWLQTFCRRFFNQQFKRSCLPDGPKVGSVSLSPRGDWRMPSDASAALWLKECE